MSKAWCLAQIIKQGLPCVATVDAGRAPGDPLIRLEGHPLKVTQTCLQDYEMLCSALLQARAARRVPMRVNNFQDAVGILDHEFNGTLSGDSPAWAEQEGCKLSMVFAHALRAVKRKGDSHCYSTLRLKALWLRAQPSCPSTPPASSISVSSSESPLQGLPEFDFSDGEAEPALPDPPETLLDAPGPAESDSVSSPSAPLDAPGHEIDSVSQPSEPSVSPRRRLHYKRCIISAPAHAQESTDVDVLDHQGVKEGRRTIRAERRRVLRKRPEAPKMKKPSSSPMPVSSPMPACPLHHRLPSPSRHHLGSVGCLWEKSSRRRRKLDAQKLPICWSSTVCPFFFWHSSSTVLAHNCRPNPSSLTSWPLSSRSASVV